MRVDFSTVGPEITSARWLDALAVIPRALRDGARGKIVVDLSSITWIGNLPLMAICLGIQEIARAKFDEQRIVMPNSPSVRAFLDRWRFYRLARQYDFIIETEPVDKAYGETTLGSTVLEIHAFDRMSHAEELRTSLRQADEHLKNILLTGAFLDEQEIEGLADLIVYELCKNAVEHAETDRAAVIFGRVSRDHDPSRPIYEKNPAPWEGAFFKSIRGEGMTELVIGDAGIGIIPSLREEAGKPPHRITDPGDILKWAFQPFSTRKRERAAHTRGLWAVKNKVRDLGGILHVRSGEMVGGESKGGWSVSWDFFHHPSKDEATPVADAVAFGGTQVQILLPHRMSRFTFVEYHRRALAPEAVELESDELLVPAEPAPLPLASKIAKLRDRTVLFVDMSQMDVEKWTRAAIDDIGRQISDGLRRQHARVWLLNPPERIVQELAASSWITALWQEQAMLLPLVRIGNPGKPPIVSFVVSSAHLRWTGPGDTAEARTRLVNLIAQLVSAGQNIAPSSVADLNPDERNFVLHAIGTNQAIVHSARGADGAFTGVLDVERLGRKAVAALLAVTLRHEIEQRLRKAAEEGVALWYRLPSEVYCRQYIDPHIVTSLPPATADALEKWIEDKITEIRPTHAISYTMLADYLLTRAKRAGVAETLPRLVHYSTEAVKKQLDEIPDYGRVVILVGITGSGQTIINTVSMLAARGIQTFVVCIIDTTTASERHAVLAPMEARGEFHHRVRWEIEKYATIPPDERHLPIAIIDPETLQPVVQVPELPTRLRDGRFWRILAESEAVSVGAITYKGIDYTTMILTRNLLENSEIAAEIVDDFRNCFPKIHGKPQMPDIICSPKETLEVLGPAARRRLAAVFPKTEFLSEDLIERDDRDPKKKFEGKRVVIFAAAATSGAGIARIQKYFQTAARIHISILINRVSDGLMVALTGSGGRISFTAFQRLVSGSPDLRLGSSRSIALPALLDYRASCLSNRLLLFIDELRRETGEPVRVAQSPDELEAVVQPEPPPHVRFDDNAVYSFGTADGMESLQGLVRFCTKPDEKWLYGILDEVASRAEASLRNFQRESREWQRAYLDDLARLYRSAPDGDDLSARKTILEALLLHRWRWSEARDLRDKERKQVAAAEPPDDDALAFAQELLTSLTRATDPEFRTVVIRAISKIHRGVLISSLHKIIDIARSHRRTELTLALELTKILDDRVSAERLMEQLSKIVADRARARPAGRDEPFDVALADLFADIGLHVVDNLGQPVVEFLPWSEVRSILQREPPDHNRTIRLLIRSMRGRFGRHARFLYYRKEKIGNYAYGDAWPRRGVTDKSRIPEANIRAIELLEDRDFFLSERIGSDKRTENYRRRFPNSDLSPLGMALYRLRFGEAVGLLRVWQNVDDYGPLDREAAFDMDVAVSEAVALIEREPSTIRVIGEWQYEQMINSLTSRGDGASEYEAVGLFTDRIRELLGGDVASLLTLDENGDWTRQHLSGRGRSLPLKFPNEGRDRLTVVVAAEREGRIYPTIDAAAADGFTQRPAVPWAQSWFALPLLYGQERCRAVIHVWHHIPGWFDQARSLLEPLQSLGGTVMELSSAYVTAHQARQRRATEHDETERLSAKLLNLVLSAEALASESMERDPESPVLRTLVPIIREMQERLATFLEGREVPQTAPVRESLQKLLAEAVIDANTRYGDDLFLLRIREDVPVLQLRKEMMRRAIDELLKNAKSHLAPDERVRVDLMHDMDMDAVVVDVQNPGYGVPAELKERIFGMGFGLLLAKAAAETHGGTLEEIGEPGAAAVFRMVLPIRRP